MAYVAIPAASGGGAVSSATLPLSISGGVLSLGASSAVAAGSMSSSDYSKLLAIPSIVSGRTTVAGGTTDTITISGLHGDTEGDYEFGGVLLFTTAAANITVKLQPNADTGNAACEYANPQVATAFAGGGTFLLAVALNTTTAGTTGVFRGFLRSKKGDGLRLFTSTQYDTEVGGRTALLCAGNYTEVATEVTSLKFLASAVCLLNGSYVWWRSMGNTA